MVHDTVRYEFDKQLVIFMLLPKFCGRFYSVESDKLQALHFVATDGNIKVVGKAPGCPFWGLVPWTFVHLSVERICFVFLFHEYVEFSCILEFLWGSFHVYSQMGTWRGETRATQEGKRPY